MLATGLKFFQVLWVSKPLTLEDVEACTYHNRWVVGEDIGPVTRWRKLTRKDT